MSTNVNNSYSNLFLTYLGVPQAGFPQRQYGIHLFTKFVSNKTIHSMKRIIPLVIIAIIFSCKTNANPVSSTQAQMAGTNFYKLNTTKNISTVSLAYTEASSGGNPLYYVFNINANDGFVIVAADDASHPILGYSDKGHYDNMNLPANFKGWMNIKAKQLADIQTRHLTATSDITNEWTSYTNAKRNTKRSRLNSNAVSPLSNVIWNQGGPFNGMCPGGSVTGCCATAEAQIMQYWKYPLHGILGNTYNENTPQYSNNYGVISRNFYADTFHWANMPDTINGPNNDVALLMYDCGISLDMNYAPGGSNAEVICPNSFSNFAADSVSDQTAYWKFFGYNRHTLQGFYKAQFTDTVWITMLENELNNHRVVQYTGGGDIGHTWVCEGYDTNTFFFMNWGWGGSPNGYFSLNNLNPYSYDFDSLQQALIGIEPPAASAQFLANHNSVSTGSSVYFTDESLTPTRITSWTWSFPGGTPSTSHSQNPLVTYYTPGIYNVTLVVTAPGGGDTITKANYIAVQPANNPLPLDQTFESSTFPPAGWYLNNPENWNASNDAYGSIWQLYSHPGGGGYGLSNSCMMFYNFNSGYNEYLLNQPPPPNPIGGQNQQIYTPAYSFRGISNDSIYFDVAYAPFNTVYSDTLAVYYSLDCGITWTNIYYKGGADLSTGPAISVTSTDTLGFIPAPNQWRTDVIQLPSALYGQPTVMFSFENRSYWGGQLYIDNINIPTGTTLAVNKISSPEGSVVLYPNPNNGEFTIQSSVVSQQWSVEVYNVLGEKVFTEILRSAQNDNLIDLSAQPSGVYFYRVLKEDGSLAGSGKMIIQK
jgi:PKD repeat protein